MLAVGRQQLVHASDVDLSTRSEVFELERLSFFRRCGLVARRLAQAAPAQG